MIKLLILMILILPSVYAVPPIAAEYYGNLQINEMDAPNGTLIEIKDVDGTICGSQVMDKTGSFGLISCRGDDPSTPVDEGARSNEQISINVNGRDIYSLEWVEADIRYLNLTTKDPVITFPLVLNISSIVFMIGLIILSIKVFIKQQKK